MSRQFVYKDDDLIETPFNWRQIGRLAVFFKPYRKEVFLTTAITLVFGMLTRLCLPFLMGTIIDKALGTGDRSLLVTLALVMLAIHIVRWFSGRYTTFHTNLLGQHVIRDIRAALFKHIQSLSFRFFDKRPAGSVLVRITNDVNALQELFTNGIINTIIDIIQLIGIIIILLVLKPQLGLAVMVTVPIMYFVTNVLRKRIRMAWQAVRIKQSRINAHLNESIQGIRVTQAYAQEKENIGFFDSMNSSNLTSYNFASALNQTFGPVFEITATCGSMILILYGSWLIKTEAMTVGLLIMYLNYVGQFWEPMNRLGNMYSQLLVAMSSAERIFEYLDEKPNVPDKPDAIDLPPIVGHVKLEGVTFEYEPGRPALKNITLDIAAGTSVALVGHTGSGKSTIVNLMCRFYDATEGRVLIDGTDIRNAKTSSLRSQIGIVLQDTFIFSGTIRDNIRYGRPDATDAEVEAAARAVKAHDFIVQLKDGYSTEVQERGNVLSVGQRQLLSFARALLADPRILVLDEATASIDTETEKQIQEALATLLKNRTSIIVAHRLSTIRGADKIVVLDHGVIVDQGNHEQLMARPGHYRDLVEAQYRFLSA